MAKYFHIPWFVGKEGARLQIRGEFFNLFNRTNLNNVSSDLSFATRTDMPLGTNTDPSGKTLSQNASFGKALGAFNPRQLEVALRLEF